MKNVRIALGCALVAGLCSISADAQVMGMNGTWVLDYKTSQGPIPKCEYLHYTITPEEQHYVVDEINADGKKFNTEYRAKFDGREHPNKNLVSGTVTYVKIRKVFDRVEQLTNYRVVKGPDGKETKTVSGHYIRVLSPDGKTITSTLINADGQVTAVRDFRRVEGQEKPKC